MPGVMALIDEGTDILPGTSRKRWQTVLRVSAVDLARAARDGRLDDLLREAAKRTRARLRPGEKIIGYGFAGRGLSKMNVPTKMYLPEEVKG